MLVLKRKIGESLYIDETTEVRVLEIRGGRVRLGITCPANVRICRSELIAELAAEHERLIARPAKVLKAK